MVYDPVARIHEEKIAKTVYVARIIEEEDGDDIKDHLKKMDWRNVRWEEDKKR